LGLHAQTLVRLGSEEGNAPRRCHPQRPFVRTFGPWSLYGRYGQSLTCRDGLVRRSWGQGPQPLGIPIRLAANASRFARLAKFAGRTGTGDVRQ
jgi:hypothetical protein